MTDDKKTDRVISMADFKKSAEKDCEDSPNLTPNEVLEFMKQHSLETVVVLGQQEDGRFRFGGNIVEMSEVLFLLEAYKKIILDSLIGVSYE